ncbi:uncharacterized protein LOC117339517 isoform X1 [Pecten maximus]|uniref:uncharacterized protein LOC117339517 isoform X1 n=1 Tax=Pecten maximus TaxID=6579 RepID=UPI001457FBC5|nr:uncharacterized protein LOC117339517 isoform X1 [Pecten maximus]
MDLANSMSTHILKSRGDNTVSKYYGSFRRWERFINTEGGSAIPAQPVHVALYLTSLIDKNCSVSVIQSAIYGIKWAHSIRGMNDPTDNHYIKHLLESCKRQNSVPVVRKDIVTSEQIVSLCEKYGSSNDILVLRDLSMIVLSFSGFLRFQEVSNLRCKDLSFHENFMSLFLVKSKTDQYRQGSKVLINEGRTTGCPIRILKRYISTANVDLKSGEFLFKPAYRSKGKCCLIKKNKPISYTRARETILARLKEVCGDANLGLHSMRAGGASMAARSAVNDRCWKRHGRWRGEKSKDGYVEDTIEKRLEKKKNYTIFFSST